MAEEKMVAFCGIVCTDCPAFIATQNNDDKLREKTAKKWSSEEHSLKAEDVNCDGCPVVGKRVMEFISFCKVRKCALEKGVKNCAYCEEYPCKELGELWKQLKLPEAKETLEEIRKTMRA
ncbi:DUF3795 domain-containing protein [candidate division WOR-3 bacterium]|nr:DUF3795 domain-containing protein [candidate division WOR-3 bacterium]